MIVYKSKQWIWFKKGTGEVMTKTKISFDLGIPFNCIQYVDVITNLQIDNALEPEIVNAIRQMEKEQKQALELLEKQVARFCNGQTKRHLIKKFAELSRDFNDECLAYQNIINVLLFSANSKSIPRAETTVQSFRELLKLFLEKVNTAQSTADKCEAIETVLDWIAEAPRTFKRYLVALGIPVEGDFPKKFTPWPNDKDVTIPSGAMSTAFLLCNLESWGEVKTIYPLEAVQLKNCLIQYYTYTDSTWTLDKRRGYIFEELVFAIGPEGFKGPCTSDYESHRNVRFYNDCGQTICGNHDLDIVFKSKTSLLGAECKVKLSNWLYFANRITSNAQRKLDFMKCVLFASKKVGFHSTQCLVTLEEKTEGCTQILQSNSCDIIKIYNYESLIVACSKGTNMPAKYSS